MTEGIYKEKMPKEKNRKFVAEEENRLESEMKNPNQDGEELVEVKEAVTEQENELGAKTEVAGKPETIALPSNPDNDDSEELNETEMEKKTEMGAKNEEAGKTETGFTPSDRGEEESNKLKDAVTEEENGLGAKTKEAGKPEERSVKNLKGTLKWILINL